MEQQKGYITRAIDSLKSWYRKEPVPEAIETTTSEVTPAKITLYRQPAEVPTEEPVPVSSKPQHFPLEKILRISAGEYCKKVGKQVSDYEIHGIQVGGNSQYDLGLFVGLVPKNAEVVVAYQTVKENRGVSLKGTALIPKYEALGVIS